MVCLTMFWLKFFLGVFLGFQTIYYALSCYMYICLTVGSNELSCIAKWYLVVPSANGVYSWAFCTSIQMKSCLHLPQLGRKHLAVKTQVPGRYNKVEQLMGIFACTVLIVSLIIKFWFQLCRMKSIYNVTLKITNRQIWLTHMTLRENEAP